MLIGWTFDAPAYSHTHVACMRTTHDANQATGIFRFIVSQEPRRGGSLHQLALTRPQMQASKHHDIASHQPGLMYSLLLQNSLLLCYREQPGRVRIISSVGYILPQCRAVGTAGCGPSAIQLLTIKHPPLNSTSLTRSF